MREGHFLNGCTGQSVAIFEHQSDLRHLRSLPRRLGISSKVVREADRLHPDNREAFLTYVLKKTNLCRVRGHLEYTTVEFFDTDIITGLAIFADRYLCPETLLKLVDLADMSVEWLRAGDLTKTGGEK